MRDIENQERIRVEGGQVVRYTVTPVYFGDHLIPRGMTSEAQGSGGFYIGVSVLNPPGVP